MLRLPYMLKSDVDWEKYSERTDMFNVHGSWEWIDRKVYVYELPLGPHETCSEAIKRQIHLADPERMLVGLGSVRKYLTFFWERLLIIHTVR